MNLSNYKYNAIGGIDADRTLEGGDVVKYTLTAIEEAEVESDISGSQEAAQEALRILRKVAEFKSNRESSINTASVTANGFIFDADEISIGRLANAILAAYGESDSYVMQWSLADTATGVMTDVTLADLKLAHKMAVINMASVWGVNEEE